MSRHRHGKRDHQLGEDPLFAQLPDMPTGQRRPRPVATPAVLAGGAALIVLGGIGGLVGVARPDAEAFAGSAVAGATASTSPSPSEPAPAPAVAKPVPAGLVAPARPADGAAAALVDAWVVEVPWAILQSSPGAVDTTVLDGQVEAARAAGKRVVVRVLGGVDAPPWLADSAGTVALSGRGAPAGGPLQVPRWWTPEYLRAVDQLHATLAARYDREPAVAMVDLCGASLQGCVPYWRGAEYPGNARALLAAGFTLQLDAQALAANLDLGRYWATTPVRVFFQPYQAVRPDGTAAVDPASTAEQMRAFRARHQGRAVLALSPATPRQVTADPATAPLLDALRALGGPIGLTADPAGTPEEGRDMLDVAGDLGAVFLEAPPSYAAWSAEEIRPAVDRLRANAAAPGPGAVPPPAQPPAPPAPPPSGLLSLEPVPDPQLPAPPSTPVLPSARVLPSQRPLPSAPGGRPTASRPLAPLLPPPPTTPVLPPAPPLPSHTPRAHPPPSVPPSVTPSVSPSPPPSSPPPTGTPSATPSPPPSPSSPPPTMTPSMTPSGPPSCVCTPPSGTPSGTPSVTSSTPPPTVTPSPSPSTPPPTGDLPTDPPPPPPWVTSPPATSWFPPTLPPSAPGEPSPSPSASPPGDDPALPTPLPPSPSGPPTPPDPSGAPEVSPPALPVWRAVSSWFAR